MSRTFSLSCRCHSIPTIGAMYAIFTILTFSMMLFYVNARVVRFSPPSVSFRREAMVAGQVLPTAH